VSKFGVRVSRDHPLQVFHDQKKLVLVSRAGIEVEVFVEALRFIIFGDWGRTPGTGRPIGSAL